MAAYFRWERFASCWAHLLFLFPCSQEAAAALLFLAILIRYTSNSSSSRVRTSSISNPAAGGDIVITIPAPARQSLITLLLTPGFSTVFFNHIKGHFKQLLIMVSHLKKKEETGLVVEKQSNAMVYSKLTLPELHSAFSAASKTYNEQIIRQYCYYY